MNLLSQLTRFLPERHPDSTRALSPGNKYTLRLPDHVIALDKLRTKAGFNFIVKAVLVLITVVVLDSAIGGLLRVFYFRQTSGLEYRTTFSLERTTADLVVLGSSTANHNYVPGVLGQCFGMAAYNAGRDGVSVFYDFAILKGILRRYSPKVIVLDFDKQEFSKDKDSYDRLSVLLPYYKSHPEIRPIVNLKGPFEKFKLLSKIYPYNSLLFTIAVGNAEFNKNRSADINGYMPLTNKWNEPIKDGNTFPNYEIDSQKVNVFESLIRECVAAKVELYIVCSPVYIRGNYINKSILLGKTIADRYGIAFLDYSKDSSVISNRRYFADVSHLNSDGALLYSQKVAKGMLEERQALAMERRR